MKSQDILRLAADLTSGDRDRQHGAKKTNHQNIAALWNGFLWDILKRPITESEAALMMALLKIARTKVGALNPDDYVDGAGYIGCAGEIVLDTCGTAAAEDGPLYTASSRS